MDKHVVALWLLDFLLRQPLDDTNLNCLVRMLHRSDTHSNLKKLLLLRKIESEISKGSISENLLELLEQMEELEYRDKIGATAAMKNAYCAVAVHCTVRFLEENNKEKYFEAVKNIWRTRVRKMETIENVGLLSDELLSWSDEIETAVWDESVCMNLLPKRKGIDVLDTVRVYVEEAKKSMGPSFLDLLAEKLISQQTLWELLGLGSKDMNKGNLRRKRKRATGKSSNRLNSRMSRGVKIVDTDDLGVGTSPNKYGCLSYSEVTKLQEALRSSSSELQATVKDPLPDALQMAKNVISNMSSADRSADVGQTDNINLVNKGADVGQADKINLVPKGADVGQADKINLVPKGADVGQAEKISLVNKGCSHQTNDPKPSLMARNSTARTYEWDESIDGSADRSSIPHLPTPKERVVSPLKRYDKPKPLRRKRKLWSNLEEDTLRTGVQKYGAGNWKLILKTYADIFDDRTEVDLKDKWRNLTAG